MRDDRLCGELKAATGSFSGRLEAAEIKAATITGTVKSDGNGKIVGPEICVPNEYNPKFHVDSQGNVTINKGSISWGAVTGTDEIDQRIDNAQKTANSASSAASTAASNIHRLANGTYTGGTFIDGTHVVSPYITGGRVAGSEIFGGIFGDYDDKTPIEDWNPNVWIKMGDDNGGGYGMNVWSASKYGMPILRVYDDKSGGVALQIRGLTVIEVTGSNEVRTPYFHYTLA